MFTVLFYWKKKTLTVLIKSKSIYSAKSIITWRQESTVDRRAANDLRLEVLFGTVLLQVK